MLELGFHDLADFERRLIALFVTCLGDLLFDRCADPRLSFFDLALRFGGSFVERSPSRDNQRLVTFLDRSSNQLLDDAADILVDAGGELIECAIYR